MARGGVIVQRFGGPNAPLRGVLRANQQYLDAMKPRARSRVVKLVFNNAAHNWRSMFMRIRFSKRVLSAPFNYQGDPDTPLVGWHRGKNKSAIAAYTGKITVRKKQGSGDMVIRIPVPLGHPVNNKIIAVINTVPAREIQWTADDAAAGFVGMINSNKPQAKVKQRRPDAVAVRSRRQDERNRTVRRRKAREAARRNQ